MRSHLTLDLQLPASFNPGNPRPDKMELHITHARILETNLIAFILNEFVPFTFAAGSENEIRQALQQTTPRCRLTLQPEARRSTTPAAVRTVSPIPSSARTDSLEFRNFMALYLRDIPGAQPVSALQAATHLHTLYMKAVKEQATADQALAKEKDLNRALRDHVQRQKDVFIGVQAELASLRERLRELETPDKQPPRVPQRRRTAAAKPKTSL